MDLNQLNTRTVEVMFSINVTNDTFVKHVCCSALGPTVYTDVDRKTNSRISPDLLLMHSHWRVCARVRASVSVEFKLCFPL